MKAYFFLLASLSLLFSMPVKAAERMDCGLVSIDTVLAGPRHGAMMRVSNASCGASGGWVCLDPDGEHMSPEESDRLYSFVLANKMAKQQVVVSVYADVYAAACGEYPVLEDIRTP